MNLLEKVIKMDENKTVYKVPVAHHDSLVDALLCHFPYAILSVALSIVSLSVIMFSQESGGATAGHAHRLFHTLHLMHILFAGTGVVLTFRTYCKSIPKTIAIGILVPLFFCTLSDVLMPYLGGIMLQLPMKLHWCFWSHFTTVATFLVAGLINGFILSLHNPDRYGQYSIGSHFLHIFVSSLASTFYFVSFGLEDWSHHLGFLFVFLVFAVVIPCTLADIVVPMFFGKQAAIKTKQDASDDCCGEKKNARDSD